MKFMITYRYHLNLKNPLFIIIIRFYRNYLDKLAYMATSDFFFFFAHKKLKKPPSKVAHNRPKPFIPQPSRTHSQQPKVDFSYHNNVPPSVCSLVCGMQYDRIHPVLNFDLDLWDQNRQVRIA